VQRGAAPRQRANEMRFGHAPMVGRARAIPRISRPCFDWVDAIARLSNSQ
jgi:hypothetical protein